MTVTPLGLIFLVVGIVLVVVLGYVLIAGSSSLRNYVIARLLLTIPMVLILLTLIFVVLRVLPGDPVESELGPRGSPELRAELRAQFGLDKPLGEQYLTYLGQILQGNLGRSMVEANRP